MNASFAPLGPLHMHGSEKAANMYNLNNVNKMNLHA